MIKAIYVVATHRGLSLEEARQHWFEVHGRLGADTPGLRRYVQHHTLFAAYNNTPRPTHDGASIVWFDNIDALTQGEASPPWQAMASDGRCGVYGGRQLFQYPMPFAIAKESVIVEGETSPLMVKGIGVAAKLDDVSRDEFHDHWLNVHGPLAARVPGIRKYVQNHTIKAAYKQPRVTFDGWSEAWFDDFDAFKLAIASPEWTALAADGKSGLPGGRPLFDYSKMCLVIGRERQIVP